MRNAQTYLLNIHLSRYSGDLTAEINHRPTELVILHFDIRPGYLSPPAGPEHLQYRFLRSETPGQFFRSVLYRASLGLLGLCENTIEKTLPVSVNKLGYTGKIYQVYPVNYRFH
jgi:hypothetical protein